MAGEQRWCGLVASRRTAEVDASEARLQRTVDRADFDPAYDPDAPITCEVCGFEMRYVAACKILCSNCGYKRDCSDP
jgi:hypothetical protein